MPPVPTRRAAAGCPDGCFAQVELTGDAIADHVAARCRARRSPCRPGRGRPRASEFCVPLENNLFRAAFEAGLFGERQALHECSATGPGRQRRSTRTVAVLDVGPDLQFIANPGEAFPALMLGGPWGGGIEGQASCPQPREPAGADLARHAPRTGSRRASRTT